MRAGRVAGAALLAACQGAAHDGTMRLPSVGGGSPPAPTTAETPVAINPESPIVYPEPLRAQGIEGTVVLRLYTDTSGTLIPESTRVVESSGYPALDSAALAGAPRLRFAPGVYEGRPVATAFLQPVQFRQSRRRR